jgi:nitrogen fixation NifU-like protein
MNKTDDLYREIIIDRYRNPTNRGRIVGVEANKANLLCGDKLIISAEIDNGVIKDIKFDGGGCAISMAAVDMLLDKIKGKKLTEVKRMKGEEIEGMMGVRLTPARKKCAYLGLEVVKKLVE